MPPPQFPGSQPSATLVPQSPLDLGDLITTACKMLWRKIGTYLGLSAIILGITLLVVGAGVVGAILVIVFARENSGVSAAAIVGAGLLVMLAALVAIVVAAKFTMMLYAVAEAQAHESDISLGQASERTRGSLVRYIVAQLLYTVLLWLVVGVAMLPLISSMAVLLANPESESAATTVGGAALLTILLMLALVPVMVFLSTKFAYLAPIAALEQVDPMGVLKRSWELVRDSFWRTFLYLLVAGLLVAVVQQVLAQVTRPLAAAVTIGGRNDTYTQAAAAMIALALSMGLGMLGQLLTTPFMAIYTYLMYLDQTRRDRGEVKAAWPPGEPWQSPEYPRYPASNQYPQQGDRPYYEQQYPPQYPGNQPYQGN